MLSKKQIEQRRYSLVRANEERKKKFKEGTNTVKYRYTFNRKDYTRAMIAELLGLSRERVRKLHNTGKLHERVMQALMHR